jgi:hypothetical protein
MVMEIHMLIPKLSILDCQILWFPITIENIGQNDQNNRNVTEIWLPIIYHQNHFTNDKIFDKKPGRDPKKGF